MIRRALLHTLLALCLVLSGLTAVVAETRMAAAGGYCGNNAPQLLLDAVGLPHLDADGQAIAAPDCPTCHLTFVLNGAAPRATLARSLLLPTAEPLSPESLSALVVHLGGQARAPPAAA